MTSEIATLDLARQLISRPSVTPDDSGCQEVISKRLQRVGFNVEPMNSGEVKNLWARRGTEAPLLVYVGHTDVVPTGDVSLWKYPPFSATVADGMLHGRGAADMKGSVAAMVTACERLFENHFTGQGSVALLITSDEEGVAVDGTRHALDVLSRRSESIDYCLVGEPTSEDYLGDTVKIGRRGSISCSLIVYGKQGHVAYPHLADNPIHRAGALIEGMANMSWDDGDDKFPNTSLQISNVHSGVGAENVIPGQLELKMNFRYSPNADVAALSAEIEGLCQKLGLNYEATWYSHSDPYYTRESEFTEVVTTAIQRVLKCTPKISTSGGTSDGRFVAKTGAQVVEFGPLNATIHKLNECVSVEDLKSLSMVYEKIMQMVLQR